MDDRAYLVRYGSMGYVGRFRASASACGEPLERGESVVIRTDRGVELGEALIALDNPESAPERPDGLNRILRAAGPDDHERRQRAEALRLDRFEACRRVLDDEGWPWDIVDVEPLLDDGATVVQYLGPHHLDLDVAAIRARFRMSCGLDVVLEPVGTDPEPVAAGCGSGGCGSGGCGSGGCGSGGCGSSGSQGGCDSCALSQLVSRQAGATIGTA